MFKKLFNAFFGSSKKSLTSDDIYEYSQKINVIFDFDTKQGYGICTLKRKNKVLFKYEGSLVNEHFDKYKYPKLVLNEAQKEIIIKDYAEYAGFGENFFKKGLVNLDSLARRIEKDLDFRIMLLTGEYIGL